MLFQESQFKSPRRRDPGSSRRLILLLVFALLVIGGGFLLSQLIRFDRQDAPGAGKGRPPDPAAGEGTPVNVPIKRPPAEITPPSVLPPLPAPEPVAAPQPFEEDPALLEKAAASDRSELIHPEGLVYLLHDSRSGRRPAAGEPEAVQDGFDVWNELMRDPAGRRGAMVFLEGRLITHKPGQGALYPAGLPAGNPSGLTVYYLSYLFSGGKHFLVATWRAPEVPLEDGDAVRVRGRFLQIYKGDVVHRGQITKGEVPVLVSAAFTRLPPPPPPGLLGSIAGNPEVQLFIGMAAVFIAGLLAAVWILRRGNRRFEEKIREVRERLGVHKDTRIGSGPGRFRPGGVPGGGDEPR